MGTWNLLLISSLLALSAPHIEAFTYSCEELRYHFINFTFADNLTHVCVVPEDGFHNYNELKKLHLTTLLNFADIANAAGHCVRKTKDAEWKLTATDDVDCSQKFTLIMSSQAVPLIEPQAEPGEIELAGRNSFVAPRTGMWIQKRRKGCGKGNVTVYTGAGSGEEERRFKYRSWPCADAPNRMLIFDDVITIETDAGVTFTIDFSNYISYLKSFACVEPDEYFVVLSSGKSDNQQNIQGIDHLVPFKMENDVTIDVTVKMDLTFDSANTGSVVLQKSSDVAQENFYNGTYTENFSTNLFAVRYVPRPLQPAEIYYSQDHIIVEVWIGGLTPPPPPVDPYCNCAVDKFGQAIGWKYEDIWLDIVVILDASEAMGQESLEDAVALVESFTSVGFLNTDTTSSFYTRVGVISMADTATVLYNLNMTNADKVQGKVSVKKGVKEINIADAFDAALQMFNDNNNRAGTRQVIYYMTNSNPGSNLDSLSQFKASNGVIIVESFLAQEIPALKDVASDGYYFTNINYLEGLQAFCKANCFCKSTKKAYGSADPALAAAGGCYHASTTGVPFNAAHTTCAVDDGILATVHDDKKGSFLQQLVAAATTRWDYYWIGYQKSDFDGTWLWEDGSSDPYTNWGTNEPSTASVARCAYVDTTTSNLPWGAGNCQLGFPYACQYAPCSVGYKDC